MRPPRIGVARRPAREFDRRAAVGRRDVNRRAILVLLRVDPGHDVRDPRAVRRDIQLGDRLESEEVGGVHAVRETTPGMTGLARSEWVFSKTAAVARHGLVTGAPFAEEAGGGIL